jgi:hypothetical protein
MLKKHRRAQVTSTGEIDAESCQRDRAADSRRGPDVWVRHVLAHGRERTDRPPALSSASFKPVGVRPPQTPLTWAEIPVVLSNQ